MKPHKNIYPEGASTSAPMFSRVARQSITFTLSAPTFGYIWSSQNLSGGTLEKKLLQKCNMNDDWQETICLSGVSLYSVTFTMSTSPFWLIWQSQHQSVGTLEKKPPKNVYSARRSTYCPMFIRGFPLFDHFYTFYTPILIYLVVPKFVSQHSREETLKKHET